MGEPTEWELAPHQYDFASNLSAPVCVLEGGLGCGKTFAALAKLIAWCERAPGVPGLMVEPTSELVGTILLASIDEFFPQWGITYQFRTQWRGRRDVLLVHPGTKRETPVYLRSGDKPHRIVGFKVGWFIIDEADQQPEEVYPRCMGRMRDARAPNQQANLVYTPEEGFNWTWTRFHEKPPKGLHMIEGIPTTANTKNPDGYADRLEEAHDETDQQRVLHGKRSRRTGLVFRRFDRERNVSPCIDPLSGRLELWCDFNVRKMAWALVSVRADRAHVFLDIVREDTDTLEVGEEARAIVAGILARERGLPVDPLEAARLVTVVCDAAGDSASTSSKQSDVALLLSLGFQVRHPAKNPFIEDSVLAVNLALAERWLQFDAAGAPYATRCVEQQPYADDGKPEKTKDTKKGLDHGGDLVRYGTFFHRPVWRPRGNDPRGREAWFGG